MSATLLTYRKLITTDVASQAVSLAESGILGHRVQCPMSVDDLNRFFIWQRPAGSSSPVGHFQQIDASGVNFNDIMLSTLGKTFIDIDGVTNGLNFSSSVLDANTDARVRLNGVTTANDICMAYMLYKCYGSSATPTMNVIYNLEDAQQMLTSGTLVLAIDNSLSTEEALSNSPGPSKGAVHAMFSDLLAADPTRFFTANGTQIPGLFEVAVDETSSGPWGFVENDKIEMRVQFTFRNPVTRSGVQDASQSSATGANTEDISTVVIPAGSTFTIRLQITATDTPSGAASKSAASATAQALADAQQQAAANKAASNAVSAASDALNAVNAAMKQKSAADAQVEKTIETNAAQAIAVSNAEAALSAAQAALAAATRSGNVANIQQQNAAAAAAQAALTNAQAIATASAAAIQTAKTAQASAVQALNTAQALAATAAANVANANAAAAAVAKKAAEDSAAAAAAAAAAATAASDPSTSALTIAQKVVLDPQTVTTAQAKANAATQIRKQAQSSSDNSKALAQMAADKLRTFSEQLALLVAEGATLSDIQVARANVLSQTMTRANTQADANAAMTTLINAANSELASQTSAATASAQRFALLLTIANAQVNTDTRARDAAQVSFTRARNLLNEAQTAANTAKTALDTAVSNGAVMTEVQTLTSKSLLANKVLEDAISVDNSARAVLTAAQTKLDTSTKAATAASRDVNNDAMASSQSAALINTQLTLATNYQNNVAFLATVNAQSKQLNDAQVALNGALVKKQAAINAYTVAKDALDAATTAGGTVPTLVALQQKAQEAADAEITAIGVWNAATTTYNTILSKIQSSSLEAVQIYSQLQQQVNVDQLALTDASGEFSAASDALDLATTTAANATAALNTAITNNQSESNINALRSLSEVANENLVNKTLVYKSKQSAYVAAQNTYNTNYNLLTNGVFGIVDGSGNSLILDGSGNSIIDASGNYILQQAATMQLASINDATANTLVNKYINLIADYNTAKANAISADNSSQAASKALQAAIVGGLTIDKITPLSIKAAEAASAASAANNLANAAQNAAYNSLGSIYTSPSAASALSILNAMLASQTAASSQSYANQLAAQLNAAYVANVNAQNAVVVAQYAEYLANSSLNNAVSGGASVSQIQKLRAVAQEAANILSTDTHTATRTSAQLSLTLGWANLDPNSKQILDLSKQAATAASRSAAINTLVLNYMNLMAKVDTAQAAKDAAQSKYTTNNAALTTAITQGQSIQQIQAARLLVQQDSAVLSQAQVQLELSKSARDTAFNNLKGRDASGNILADSSGNPFVDASGNSVNQAALDILSAALLVQQTAINNAEANVTVMAYTNAFAFYQTTLTTLQVAESALLVANRNLNLAITSGASVTEIQGLRTISETAAARKASAQTDADNALNASNAAYAVILSGTTLDASGNPVSDASGNIIKSNAAINLLRQTQLAQQAAISGAQANALARSYLKTLDDEAVANIALTNHQNAYDVASAALNQAITNGASLPDIQALQATAQTAGQVVATSQTAADAARAAVQVARQNVNANPNAVAILQELQHYQANKSSLEKASRLLNLFYTATATRDSAKNELDLATNAAVIANTALDNAINAGVDIAQIQTLQATVTQANIRKSNAQNAFDFAVSQMNQAQSNANTDPISNYIRVAARQYAEIAQATTVYNAALIAQTTAVAANIAAHQQAVYTAALSAAANALLASAIAPYDASGNPNGGKTQQEIVLLQQQATEAANASSAAKNIEQASAQDVIVKQNLVTAALNAKNALPVPSMDSTLAYTMNCVRLNETQVSTDGLTIYVDSSVLALAKTGTTIGGIEYDPVDLSGSQILGVGVSTTPTKIVSYSKTTSIPSGLYTQSSCVAIVVDNPVTAGDGVFYLVGGEVALYDYIL